MKQKRSTDEHGDKARPVWPAGSGVLAARQEQSPKRAAAQLNAGEAVGAPRRQATAVSAAAVARAVQTSPNYFSHALSRWSVAWGGGFHELIAAAGRLRSIESIEALDVSIRQQFNLETMWPAGSLKETE